MRTICYMTLALLPPPLLLLLLPVCSSWEALRDPAHIQILTYTKRTWDQARSYCRKYHSDLVTIRSEQENNDMLELAGWIGLHQSSENDYWRWSAGDRAATFTQWKIGHPKDGGNCTFKVYNELQWNSLSCDSQGPFICSEDRVLLVKEEKTWEEALAHCRALALVNSTKLPQDFDNQRYDLATLVHQDDVDYAQETAEDANTDEVWTGLRFMAGHWLWADGEPVQEGQQIPSQPTPGCLRGCGALGIESETIEARDCALRKNFLCYHRYNYWLRIIP